MLVTWFDIAITPLPTRSSKVEIDLQPRKGLSTLRLGWDWSVIAGEGFGMKALFGAVAVSFFVSQANAINPPPGLCAVLLRSGVPVTQQRINEYFAPALGHIYEKVSPRLRQKLVEGAVVMGSYPIRTENGLQNRFAGENWGTEAVSHLWLLGLSQSEIQAIVRPMLEAYYQERVLPGLLQLQKGRDFRSAVEAVPPSTTGGITFVQNGRVSGSDPDFTNLLLRARDRQEIDSSFAEIVPGIIKYFFDGSILAGDGEMAEKYLHYMLLLDSGSTEVIYGLEVLNRQAELLALGMELVEQTATEFKKDPTHHFVHQRLYSAITALARVREPELKTQANQILLQIAQAFSSNEFFGVFSRRGVRGTDLIDVKYTFFDLALMAIESMAPIVKREYVDSVRVQLFHRHNDPDPALKALALRIADEYLTLDYRLSKYQFEQLRKTLVSLGMTEQLTVYGDSLYSRRGEGLDDWNPSNLYWSAFEFFAAAEANQKASRTLNALFTELRIVPSFDREDRNTITVEDLDDIMTAGQRIGDTALLGRILALAEQNGWKKTVENLATIQSGESLDKEPRFAQVPEIPDGIAAALDAPFAVQETLDRQRRNRRQSALDSTDSPNGWALLEAGAFDEAYSAFLEAEDAEGLEALGDAYVELHRSPATSGRGRHFGASAHSAYLAAALLSSGGAIP